MVCVHMVHHFDALYIGYEMVPHLGRKGIESALNILPLPKHFDGNECFILAALLVSYAIVFTLRKRFPPSIVILVMFFGLMSAKTMNATIGVPPFDLYDNNDFPELELADVVLHFLYPPFAYLFVYLYDRLGIRGVFVLFYILGFSLFGIAFEYTADLAGVFQYKQWNLIYSFTIYLFKQCLLLLFFKMLLKHYEKTKRIKNGN